jgi:lipopolysaccharide/colanic/teichoic acid biosynthesis glycosyltransferase
MITESFEIQKLIIRLFCVVNSALAITLVSPWACVVNGGVKCTGQFGGQIFLKISRVGPFYFYVSNVT